MSSKSSKIGLVTATSLVVGNMNGSGIVNGADTIDGAADERIEIDRRIVGATGNEEWDDGKR